MAMVNIGINHGSNDFSWEHTCKLNANASVDANAHPPFLLGKVVRFRPRDILLQLFFSWHTAGKRRQWYLQTWHREDFSALGHSGRRWDMCLDVCTFLYVFTDLFCFRASLQTWMLVTNPQQHSQHLTTSHNIGNTYLIRDPNQPQCIGAVHQFWLLQFL